MKGYVLCSMLFCPQRARPHHAVLLITIALHQQLLMVSSIVKNKLTKYIAQLISWIKGTMQ